MTRRFLFDAAAELERIRAGAPGAEREALSQESQLSQNVPNSKATQAGARAETRIDEKNLSETAAWRDDSSLDDLERSTEEPALSQMSQMSQAMLDEDEHDAFEERAAILEYDEHLSRAEAERRAMARVIAGRN